MIINLLSGSVTGNEDFPRSCLLERIQSRDRIKQEVDSKVSLQSRYILSVEWADPRVGRSPASLGPWPFILYMGYSPHSAHLILVCFVSPNLCSGSWLQWVCNRILMTPSTSSFYCSYLPSYLLYQKWGMGSYHKFQAIHSVHSITEHLSCPGHCSPFGGPVPKAHKQALMSFNQKEKKRNFKSKKSFNIWY